MKKHPTFRAELVLKMIPSEGLNERVLKNKLKALLDKLKGKVSTIHVKEV